MKKVKSINNLMDLLSEFKSSLSKTSTKKTILSIFILAFLISVLPLVMTAVQYRQVFKKRAAGLTDTATLSISPATATIPTLNGTTNVQVNLNPGGASVYAVDVVLTFNKSLLKLTAIQPNTATNFKTFVPWVTGTQNFDNGASGTIITNANNTGTLEFGAVVFDNAAAGNPGYDPYASPVNGSSNVLVATLTFQGLANGIAPVNFSFNAASKDITTDANVVGVDRAQSLVDDILNSASGTSISVGTTTCAWKVCGDANCDGTISLGDFLPFRNEYLSQVPNQADFNGDGKVSLGDFINFRNGYLCLGVCAHGPTNCP